MGFTDGKIFSWSKSDKPSPSEVFVQSLPPGPLRQHLAMLHAMFMFSQSKQDATAFDAEVEDEAKRVALEAFEYHLRQIANRTIDPTRGGKGDPATPGFRKQFNKKEKS